MRSSDAASSRRILYLITNDISARFLRGQLGFLIEQGYEVHVGVGLSDPPASFDQGVVVHDLPYEREPSVIDDVTALCATVKLIREVRPGIVNSSTPKAGLLGTVAARLCLVPRRVYVVRGLRFETLKGVHRHLFRLLERLATACATTVVYNSPSLLAQADEERVIRRGRGVVLGRGSGNGIDARRYDELPSRAEARNALGIGPEQQVVGYVGRLTRDKGIVDLVEAWRASHSGFTLLLVGDFEDGDPLPDTIRHIITSSDRIMHCPWVDDTRTVYPAMDVLAFPSYREGLPNVVLEAQLARVPVVAYGATGTVDAVEDGVGGVLTSVGDHIALGVACSDLLSDDALRREMGTSGSAWVTERFQQRRVWEALQRVYKGQPPGEKIVLPTIYVAGYGRSGSSAFEMELARTVHGIAAGELGNLPTWIAAGRTCSCGEPFIACDFWGGLLARAGLTSQCDDPDHLRDVVAAEFPDSSRAQLEAWRGFWLPLLGLLAREAPGTVLVDSTKTARGRRRLALIIEHCEPVHAVAINRNLADVARSVKRGSNVAAEYGGDEPRRLPGQTLVGWTWAQMSAARQARESGTPLQIVDFEPFVRDPAVTIEALDLPASSNTSPDTRHGVAGNRARRTSGLEIVSSPLTYDQPDTVHTRACRTYQRAIIASMRGWRAPACTDMSLAADEARTGDA